jgi:protein involved in polysaccharide export with SLBB domain
MRLLYKNAFSCWCVVAILASVLSGCGTKPPPASNQPLANAPNASTDPLRVSDRIKITLMGVPDNVEASEQEIKEDGTISLQMIGRIQAAGKTPGQLERDIQEALVPRFYAHANVIVAPTGRFFYVGGEVNAMGSSGGRIIYSGPITVTRAIDAAGGFNPFANKKKVRLTRVDGTQLVVNCIRAIQHPEDDPPVYPGDRITVLRRF